MGVRVRVRVTPWSLRSSTAAVGVKPRSSTRTGRSPDSAANASMATPTSTPTPSWRLSKSPTGQCPAHPEHPPSSSSTPSARGEGGLRASGSAARLPARLPGPGCDLKPMRPADEATIELKIITNHRTDLVRDRTRAINRLRSTLTGTFPALERTLVLTSTGPLVLLDGYQTPAAIRRVGIARLTRWLRARVVRSPEELETMAFEAAEQQHTAVPGEAVIAQLVRTLAADVRVLTRRSRRSTASSRTASRAHDLAEIITSRASALSSVPSSSLAATSPSSRPRTGLLPR
ncbi:hypothetical protein E6W17_34910 [Streptomyces sp. A1547]|nr:hypothetical protein E6W17_34910 [Streptomyces sp. A1547]